MVSYPYNRYQYVRFDDQRSGFLVIYGVPQGSIVGYVVFNIYVFNIFVALTFFSHMKNIGNAVGSLSSKYDNFLIIGDFKAWASETFCDIYNFQYLIKEPTCYKNPNNPKCIDLIITNRQRTFQNSCVIDTGLSDFHKMTLTVLRSYFLKAEPKMIMYRDNKNFQIMTLDRLLTQIMENYKLLTILL